TARGELALSALLQQLGSEKHPKARRAIARALGEFRGEARAATALAALFDQGDPSYFVEAEILHSVGRLRTRGGHEVLGRGLERPSYLDVIGCAALEGLGELGDERGVPT